MGGSRSGLGPFIYKGAGKKQPETASPSQRLCTRQACLIQTCLQRYNHDQSKCDVVIESWKKCCREAEEREGKERVSGTK